MTAPALFSSFHLCVRQFRQDIAMLLTNTDHYDMSPKGLDEGIDKKLDPKVRHVVNQWYSAYQQALLGKVASHYNELECVARFVSVVEKKSLSHILADICYNGLRVRGRAKDDANWLLAVMNESDFGRAIVNPKMKFKG